MYPGGPNPTKLQTAPGSTNLPLVLIHDGGGTTFAYFFLGNLKRDVWTIHDPNYWKGNRWPGGLDEMAKHYIALIKDADIRGKILLGGWSLGGLLTMTISRMLANDPAAPFTVAGAVVIDSPYQIPISKLDEPLLDPDFSHLPKQIQASLQNCDEYLRDWELPKWTGPTKGGKRLSIKAGGRAFSVGQDQALRLSLSGEWSLRDGKPYEHSEVTEKPVAPPPGVMLRCLRKSERPAGVDRDCTIDTFRDEPLLGWEGRYADFIKATLDIDSAHFDMFDQNDDKKLEQLTARLNQGLDTLDALAKSEQ